MWGTPVLRLLEFQQSSFWCKDTYSGAPGAFSAGGGKKKPKWLCWSSPSALPRLLLSFKEVAMTPRWLPLIFIFVPAGVLTVWHFAKSNIVCTCTSAKDFYDSCFTKLLQTRALLNEHACAGRLNKALSLYVTIYQNLLFISYCCTSHYVKKLFSLFILVKDWRIFLWFLVLFMLCIVFNCHSFRFWK